MSVYRKTPYNKPKSPTKYSIQNLYTALRHLQSDYTQNVDIFGTITNKILRIIHDFTLRTVFMNKGIPTKSYSALLWYTVQHIHMHNEIQLKIIKQFFWILEQEGITGIITIKHSNDIYQKLYDRVKQLCKCEPTPKSPLFVTDTGIDLCNSTVLICIDMKVEQLLSSPKRSASLKGGNRKKKLNKSIRRNRK